MDNHDLLYLRANAFITLLCMDSSVLSGGRELPREVGVAPTLTRTTLIGDGVWGRDPWMMGKDAVVIVEEDTSEGERKTNLVNFSRQLPLVYNYYYYA